MHLSGMRSLFSTLTTFVGSVLSDVATILHSANSGKSSTPDGFVPQVCRYEMVASRYVYGVPAVDGGCCKEE